MLSGNLCRDIKPEDFENVKEKYEKAHSACLQKIEQWEKFRKDYEILKSQLERLPDRISYEVMVPFGSHAFIPGQLIHTNEVMTLLGANWFAEVSARHAAEISKRRIDQCAKMLEDLKKEREQYENWLHYMSEILCGDLIEIAEPWIEEKEKQWRERRLKKQNVKPPKLSEAEMNASSPEQKCQDVANEMAEASDKDYFQILENLGKQESLGGELNESMSEVDDDDGYNCGDFHDSSEGGAEEKKDDEDSSDEHYRSNGKHVKWKDQEGEKMKNRITFTHSSRKCKSHSNIKPLAISKTKSKTKESVPLSPVKIQNPSDIYKCFSTKPEHSKPKSILKRRTSVDDTDALTELETECATMNNVEDDVPIFKTRFKEQTAFTGEIVEHGIDKTSLSENIEVTQRPPSRFKEQRQNRQR